MLKAKPQTFLASPIAWLVSFFSNKKIAGLFVFLLVATTLPLVVVASQHKTHLSDYAATLHFCKQSFQIDNADNGCRPANSTQCCQVQAADIAPADGGQSCSNAKDYVGKQIGDTYMCVYQPPPPQPNCTNQGYKCLSLRSVQRGQCFQTDQSSTFDDTCPQNTYCCAQVTCVNQGYQCVKVPYRGNGKYVGSTQLDNTCSGPGGYEYKCYTKPSSSSSPSSSKPSPVVVRKTPATQPTQTKPTISCNSDHSATVTFHWSAAGKSGSYNLVYWDPYGNNQWHSVTVHTTSYTTKFAHGVWVGSKVASTSNYAYSSSQTWGNTSICK